MLHAHSDSRRIQFCSIVVFSTFQGLRVMQNLTPSLCVMRPDLIFRGNQSLATLFLGCQRFTIRSSHVCSM